MSDTPEPPAEAPAEVPAEAVDPLDMEIPAGVDTFDRKYVTELREEARNNRHRAEAAEAKAAEYAVLEQFEDSDKKIWLNMIGTWAGGNETGSAQMMQQIATNVLGDPNATQGEKAEAVADVEEVQAAEADPTMTAADVQKLVDDKIAARDANAAQEQEIRGIHATIADAGYEEKSVDSFAILWLANNDPNAGGDLAKAIEIYQARDQKVIDGYLEKKTGVPTPSTMPTNGTPGAPNAPAPTRGRELEDARIAADAWLNSRSGA